MPDLQKRYERMRWVIAKLEHNHLQVDEMMALHIKDGLSAMSYGQFGGSFPNPTQNTVINNSEDRNAPIWARDNVAETDRIEQWADFELVEKALERMDARRRRYMSANLDIRNRLDPSEFCHIHFALHIYEGHRRRTAGGNLCTICYEFMYGTKDRPGEGREPTPTEADYYHRHGRWPHKLYDPKARKAV